MKQKSKNWQCQECGWRLTLAAAERAMYGPNGCPGCGGSDIDLASAERFDFKAAGRKANTPGARQAV